MNSITTYENLLNILAKAPGHIYWKDTKGIYQGSNDAQAIFLGYNTGKDLIGKTDFDLPWREQAIHLQQIDNQVMETKKEYSIEEVVTSLAGVKTIFLSRKIPLYDPNNKKVIGIIGISLDITASKQAELAKQQFIMNMAHDLRTPLAGIIGIADIQANQGTSPQDKEYGLWILNASRQLLDLLNAVLKIIATEQIEDSIAEETVDLPVLMEELKDLIQPSIIAKKLKFECISDSSLPSIISDNILIKRILLNLLSNAIKFTNKGKISLEVNLLDIKDKRAKIEIQVKDTGIGIANDELDKIFDRFYRGHPSYQAEYKGYGIGLFLVKKALELLGGEIKVFSKEGKGSCFILIFNFPLAEENIKQTSPAISQQSTPQPKADKRMGSVLVAEDNSLVLHAVKNILVNLGYEVTTVSEGKAALHALQSQSFDWVLLDIGLPDLEGTEVARLYRQWEQENNNPHLPIFALTAHKTAEVKKKCEIANIDYILNKPFTIKDVQIIKLFMENKD
ncbi:ATP-binding protein [Rickettsiella endosymbiont of Xylota segnis]|uniref:ATP-binding protein n=1 Tax=Rickettsiella endosymbiont of Xylota segnis TaxID=3066238 RepID=UPI0030D1FA91